MTEIIIRQAVPEDLEEVAQIEACCFPEAEAATKESLKLRLDLFGSSFLVAADRHLGHLIGFINGTVSNEKVISDEMFQDIKYNVHADYQMIFGLDVLPQYRGQGIAGQLMHAMIKAAWEDGRRGLVLTCKEALVHYYEEFGYVNHGISASVHGGAAWYDMRLEF